MRVAAGSAVELREETLDGATIAVLSMSSPPANALGDELVDALASALDRVPPSAGALVVAS